METTGTFQEGAREIPVDTPVPPETREADRPVEAQDAIATAARLVVGATSLGVDALTEWLRMGGARRDREGTTGDEEAGSVKDAVLGVAARGAQTALAIGARGADLAGRGLRTAAEDASAVVDRAVPTFLREPLDRVRDRAEERIRDLGMTGQEELDRARAVARAAIDEGLDALFARLADSREVQLVIRTQSVTAAEEVVDGLRDRAHGIDDRLEVATRRIFRRRPRGSTSAGD